MVKLIVWDFDGVLTDNKVYLSQDGMETVACNRSDGWWLKEIRARGMDQMILTTEQNPVVLVRGKKLGIPVVQSEGEKLHALKKISLEKGVSLQEVCYAGNEMNDLECFKAAGITFAPADSNPVIYQMATVRLEVNGGSGVVKKVFDYFYGNPSSDFDVPDNTPMIYAVIPARSGSKSVVDKNIKHLSGTPLMAYSIQAALKVPGIVRVIVSTDSEKYAEIARNAGAEVPFLRPASLSCDLSTDKECMKHALAWFEQNEGKKPDYIVHLRPTTPFRDPQVVEKAIRALILNTGSSSLRSVHEIAESVYKAFEIRDSNLVRAFHRDREVEKANQARQMYPPTYAANGYVDVLRSSLLEKSDQIHGDSTYAFKTELATEVDSTDEFEYLEYLLSKNPDLKGKLFS